MYHVAKSLLYNDADCQDAIQETIAKAFDKIGTLKQDTYAKTWLIRILNNECYGIMRKEKKIISLEACEREEPWMERQDYSDLYEALMRLTAGGLTDSKQEREMQAGVSTIFLCPKEWRTGSKTARFCLISLAVITVRWN